jgi:hypothetical protein
MTEQTDAIVVVVSEESGQISLVERARIVRNLDEPRLARSLAALLRPQTAGGIFRAERTPPRRVGPNFRDLARRARFGGLNRPPRAGRKSTDRVGAAPAVETADGQEKAS